MNLISNEKLDRVMTSQAAGTGDTLSSDWVDMQGFEGVEFEASLGDVLVSAVVTLQMQTNTVASPTGATLLTDKIELTSADGTDLDDKVVRFELYKPLQRYVRLQVVRTTANAEIDGVIARLHTPKTRSVTDTSDVTSTKLIVGDSAQDSTITIDY